MSIRVVAQTVAGVKHRQPEPRGRSWAGNTRPRWWARFQDDRELVGAKLALVCAMLLIVMALEVPH